MFKSITLRWITQIIIVLCNLIGLVIFLRGFFPSKIVLPGHNTFSNDSNPFLYDNKPQFDKFILMVVDALRSDFCFSNESNFHFLHNLINNGNAIPFTAFSNPPTVTLPRLKGITTGGTPNFLDAILNVADDNDNSQGLHNQDSWIYQFQTNNNNNNNNKIINFFGDDTWLKLFPHSFNEFEGTNSFFVSDFAEVDNNVTRHLDTQLLNNQWHGLILHYLGLDHIGHKGGPNSIYMKPKQIEMDNILSRLYSYILKNQDTLIILMGDHGMNDIGNHGGSSIGETSAALSLISPKFNVKQKSPLPKNQNFDYYHKINQIDLVPILSSLLNFPIPKNSLGVISKEVLTLWPESQRLKILKENSKQIMDLYVAKHGQTEKYEKWTNLKDGLDEHYELLYEIQQEMTTSATNYNYHDIILGSAILFISTIITIITFNIYFFNVNNINIGLIVFYELFVLLYSLHFHGSSLIEEEHQLWYFFTSITLLYLGAYYFDAFKSVQNMGLYLVLLACVRIIRSWNNSGQKYSSNFNIAYFLTENITLMWILIALTYFVITLAVYVQGGVLSTFLYVYKNFTDAGTLISFICIFVSSTISFSFKILQSYIDGRELPAPARWLLIWILHSYHIEPNTSDIKFKLQEISISVSRLATGFIFGTMFLRIVFGTLRKIRHGTITDICNIITLFLIHQTKQENIPIFLILFISKFIISKLTYKKSLNIDQYILTVSTLILCFQNLTFFSFGNTNSLATIDLSNAYNGVESYDVFLVGLLTFVSNFSGVIFWSLSGLQLLFESSLLRFEGDSKYDLIHYPSLKKSIFWVKNLITLFFYAVSVVNLIGSCINLRFHLFIWTVFSPKLLYFGAWTLFVNILVDLFISWIIIYI
ncbi:unnamed protein product [Candida verbasci]|uniref:GPI ethanolamine phosphate transferase 2 n=1 Tax=Candida verbasci TaxID=1227364 RepID=A0A9W4TV18_9ASCO|nr:unnamed protein product [Candida verbasci]